MKTMKLMFTVTAFAVAAIANAVEKPKMNVIPLTADRAIVSITNENAASFELSVETNNGDLVYYKQSAKSLTDYQKIYDFANLKNGSYVLNVKVNDTKVSRNFEVSNSGITVGNSKMSFDPYFTFKDGLLKFSYLNFGRENMKLKIYDNSDNLIYQTKLGNDFAISTGYDLNKLRNGNYSVELTSFDNRYTYNFVK